MPSQIQVFKIALIGDPATGKTTLLQRFLSGRFKEDYRATLGVNFCLKSFEMSGKIITLQIWDFGGNKHFLFLVKSYCENIDAILFIYDITNSNSLNSLGRYIHELHLADDKPILFVIGTKNDLINARQLCAKEVKQYAQSQGVNETFEVSSKTGENVPLIFEKLINRLCDTQKNDEISYL